jgi:hypothetical protein
MASGVKDAVQIEMGLSRKFSAKFLFENSSESIDVPDGSAEIVRNRIAERLEFIIGTNELGGAFLDALLQGRVESGNFILTVAKFHVRAGEL